MEVLESDSPIGPQRAPTDISGLTPATRRFLLYVGEEKFGVNKVGNLICAELFDFDPITMAGVLLKGLICSNCFDPDGDYWEGGIPAL